MFDAQIKPIVLYACEAWADSIKNVDIANLLAKNKLENFQMLVFKQILGVSRKTTNLAVLLELGKYPITLNMQYQAIKYFLRFSALNKERLLYEAYVDELTAHSIGVQSFVTYATDILNNLRLSNIGRDQILQEVDCLAKHTHKKY